MTLPDDVVDTAALGMAREIGFNEFSQFNPDDMRRAARAALEAARWGELRALAGALVAKLDECAPQVANMAAINFVRSGVQYKGPSYGDDLEQLRALLSTIGAA